MNQVYVRRRPSTQETALAAALAIGVGTAIGAAAWYVARALLARDPVTPLPDRAHESLEGEVEVPR